MQSIIWQELTPINGDPIFDGLDPFLAGHLQRLGFNRREQIDAFLDPEKYIPTPPDALPGMEQLVEKLVQAIRHQQPIWVWGDFDVDGQTATSILVSTLQELGATVRFHIPVRAFESHGLNIPWLQKIHDLEGNLVLTCDTGISNHEAIQFANSLGMQVLVSDHHALPGSLPQAAAIVNPRLLPVGHPLEGLSGAGVAFKISEALFDQYGQSNAAKKNLDLVALGLVADMATLLGDTRYLVQCGLNALRSTDRLGLKILFEIAGIENSHLNESHIGFGIAPRLNALGRLGDANQAVELLTTRDAVKARVIAHTLEGMNAQRQLLTRQVMGAAEAQIQDKPEILEEPVIMLTHAEWHAGVIGIVASHLVERYHKPVILVTTPAGGLAHGSARSFEGINITEIIASQAALLNNFGGHPMAAGFSLATENLKEFQKGIQKSAGTFAQAAVKKPILLIDKIFLLSNLDFDLAQEIELLSPFGPGNPKPVLASRNVQITKTSPIGRQKEHLKLVVQDQDGVSQTLLWWNAGDVELPEEAIDLAYTLRASDWQGSQQLQIEIMDLHPAAAQPETKRTNKMKILDERNNQDPLNFLTSLPDGACIWAEGEDERSLVNRLAGEHPGLVAANRSRLIPSPVLVIWTPPASSVLLRQALQKVKPSKVIVLTGNELEFDVESFKLKLVGLLKFAIQHYQGVVSLSRLAIAMALSESTVSIGLDWLQYQGSISVNQQEDDTLVVARNGSGQDAELAQVFREDLEIRLEETAAYRRHWAKGEIKKLIPGSL